MENQKQKKQWCTSKQEAGLWQNWRSCSTFSPFPLPSFSFPPFLAPFCNCLSSSPFSRSKVERVSQGSESRGSGWDSCSSGRERTSPRSHFPWWSLSHRRRQDLRQNRGASWGGGGRGGSLGWVVRASEEASRGPWWSRRGTTTTVVGRPSSRSWVRNNCHCSQPLIARYCQRPSCIQFIITIWFWKSRSTNCLPQRYVIWWWWWWWCWPYQQWYCEWGCKERWDFAASPQNQTGGIDSLPPGLYL